MANQRLLQPQFFHTLVPGFHDNLTIPLDIFSKYIEGKSVVEKTTAELKYDSSDIIWKVKMTGRRLSQGWEEFAVAHDLQIGDVVLVKYEGDMIFHVSDLGPKFSDDQDDIGEILLKKHPRTDVDDDDDDDEELPIRKRVKKNNPEAEAVSSPSSSENSCFVPSMEILKKNHSPKRRAFSYLSYSPSHKRFVTFTLPPDYAKIEKLTLPKQFARENGINKPGEIYLTDEDGTIWPTTLLRDTKGFMRLGKGWKSFVIANNLTTSFTLKLTWEDTTPVLSLCGAESICDIVQDSVPSSQNKFVTLTITPDSFQKSRLRLPAQFLRENCINKPGEIILLGKDGTKWLVNRLLDKKGTMSLGKGFMDFAKANDLKLGESFTLELIWEDETPMLRLFSKESSSSKAKEKESISIEPRSIETSPAVQNRFVTLALTLEDVKACKLHLPSQFMKDNGINKLGKVTILGENKVELSAYLLSRDGTVAMENGWDDFCEANGVKLGDSFTLEFITEQDKATPVLRLCSR